MKFIHSIIMALLMPCLQENTFADFAKDDFEGANLVDMRKFNFKHHSH